MTEHQWGDTDPLWQVEFEWGAETLTGTMLSLTDRVYRVDVRGVCHLVPFGRVINTKEQE